MQIYFDAHDKIPAGWGYALYAPPVNEPWLFVMHLTTLRRCMESGGSECLDHGGAILFVSGARRCGYTAMAAQKLETQYGHRIHLLEPGLCTRRALRTRAALG